MIRTGQEHGTQTTWSRTQIWKLDSDTMILMLWLWHCDYDAVTIMLWLWKFDYEAMTATLIQWYNNTHIHQLTRFHQIKTAQEYQHKDKELTTTELQECAFIHWGNNNLLRNLGCEEELTIKRMEYTWGKYRLNKGDALHRQNDAQALNI